MSRIMAAVFAVVAGGCSSYHAVKLDSSGRIPAGVKAGSIVTLPRPEFVVKKVEGSDPEQYQVGYTYVPDMDERYAVRMSSSPFASIDLTLAYGENGTLSSTSVSVKDEAAPALLGVFKVAASVVGASGPGGLFSVSAQDQMGACFAARTKPATAARTACAINVESASAECGSVAAELRRRLKPQINSRDETDKGRGIAALFARGPAEESCLTSVKTKVEALLQDTYNGDALYGKVEEAFDKDTTGIPTLPDVRTAILGKIKSAIAKGDVSALKRIAYVADSAASDPYSPRFGELLGVAGSTSSDAVRLVRVLRADNVKLFPDSGAAGDHKGLNDVQTIGDIAAVVRGIDDAIALTPQAWRARYIASLQLDLAQKEKELLSADAATNVAIHTETAAIREQIASLAGVRSEYDRALAFRKLIDRVPPSASGQRLSPASEYEELRKQLANLNQAVNTAIAAALSTDPKSAKPDTLPPRTPWVSAHCVKKSKDEKWRYVEGADAPRFVVVLRRLDGTPLSPRSKGGETCAL